VIVDFPAPSTLGLVLTLLDSGPHPKRTAPVAQQLLDTYEVYVATFGKVRSGVQMAAHDFKESLPGVGAPPYYKGEQLIAAALGVVDGKDPHAELMPKSQLTARVANYLK
jgi:hypothetical protein